MDWAHPRIIPAPTLIHIQNVSRQKGLIVNIILNFYTRLIFHLFCITEYVQDTGVCDITEEKCYGCWSRVRG